MAEQHRATAALNRAVHQACARPGAREPAGVWERPAVLNLVSDLLLLFAALVLGYALVVWFLSRPLFPLREVVVVTPPGQVTGAQIEYAARSAIEGNFFSVRLDEARAAFEALPWVRRAEVRRRWPDALELRIEEHRPVAYWRSNDGAEALMVNRQGEVFEAESAARLPLFVGPPGSAAYLLARHDEFDTMLEPLGRDLVRVDLSAREAWELELDSGMMILLGRERSRVPVSERLARFVRAWPDAQRQIGVHVAVADVRYQRGFALTPADVPRETKGME